MAGHGGDVIKELETDHREVEDLFAQILKSTGGHRKSLLDEVTVELVRHSVAEEAYLYPAVREHVTGGDAMADREVDDHARVERLLKEIEGRDADDPELTRLAATLVDEVTQVGFAARLAFPVYRPRTFISPGYQDNLGWGFATALGVQDSRRDTPVIAISGDGGFMYTANEMATAVRHHIPLTTVVFVDGAFGNVRRIQEEQFGNRLIASDLANPDFARFAESFGAAAERARSPDELRGALRRALQRRDGPTLIEVPVGPMPSPWEFIMMPKVRG